jgi:GT2 family glycosyltransferase
MTPEVSVVIPTRGGRGGRLEAALAALAGQRLDASRFEVVLAHDPGAELPAPPDGLGLRTAAASAPASAAAKRNLGWRAASAPLVAFTDDDCRPDPGWLAELLAVHAREPDAVLQGPVRPDPAELERATVFWRSVIVDEPSPFYPTANVAYPRELLERLGGFDERFAGSAEDTDLGWRARESGAPAAWAEGAVVLHAVHQLGLGGYLRDAHRWRDTPLLARRHPGIREAYPARIFWTETHAALAPALLGAALARRSRGASLLLVLPYALLYRRHHGGWARTLAALPGYALVDTAQMAELARGSARHRSLVL